MSATTIAPGPVKDAAVALALGRRRRRADRIVRALCLGATLLGLAFLASIPAPRAGC